MAWYTISGRNVSWSVGIVNATDFEHFAYPDYPSEPSWFTVLPFLEDISFNLPAGVEPVTLLGYAHPPGFPPVTIPVQQFTVNFFLQQADPFGVADAFIQNSLWERWNEQQERYFQTVCLPFTFVFLIKDVALGASTVLVVPYAFISRLSFRNDTTTGAVRISTTFTTPFLQLFSNPNFSLITNYDVDAPVVLTREIVTHDFGERQAFLLDLTINNRFELVYPTRTSNQPTRYIRTAPRWLYLGSSIEANVSVIHPFVTSDEFETLFSVSPTDLTFYIRTRYDDSSFKQRKMTLHQFRISSVGHRYSFNEMVADEIRGVCRFVSWGEG